MNWVQNGQSANSGRAKGLRLGIMFGAVLALVVLAGSGGRAQNGETGGGNPIAGTWHQVTPAQVGGMIHAFMSFGTNGSFFSSSINVGGPSNGIRTELWGRYTIKPAANGMYVVTMYYQGKAPLRLCMPGMGCQSTVPLPNRPDQGLFQFQGDAFQSNNGYAGQRSSIPPAMAQRLPATWMLQPPPPINVAPGGGTAGGGRYVSPPNNIPGLGGNCDDLQQSRICTINDGYYHKDPRTGCMVCSK